MIFKEKSKGLKYVKYPEERKTLERRITFKRLIAEDINEVIAVFNKEEDVLFKIDSSMLTNLGMKYFLNKLKNLPEEAIIDYIKEAIPEDN